LAGGRGRCGPDRVPHRRTPQRRRHAPLLQALADIRPYADFHRRQEQREQAAKAEQQCREEAERQEQEAQWARAEWFDTREREMENLARLWDEATTADER
jgi:hypothetical protein